jgi:hypothetical protein
MRVDLKVLEVEVLVELGIAKGYLCRTTNLRVSVKYKKTIKVFVGYRF